jgi:hypothetical protein
MNVCLASLIEFLDTRAKDAKKGDANAFVQLAGEDLGAALVKDFLSKKEATRVEILDETPTQGKQKGGRLDRWIVVSYADGSRTLFQTEIKCSSAHGTGGRPVALNASLDDLRRISKANWEEHRKWLRTPGSGVDKVILPMKQPRGLEEIPVQPLLVCWRPVHPNLPEIVSETGSCFFEFALRNGERTPAAFETLFVFSMSLYLRGLLLVGVQSLPLDMPNVVRRLEWLNVVLSRTRK